MRRSFSVEDLLDEVEKICYDASGTSKVRHEFPSHISETGQLHHVHRRVLKLLTVHFLT